LNDGCCPTSRSTDRALALLGPLALRPLSVTVRAHSITGYHYG
jgi:hypothetical protein